MKVNLRITRVDTRIGYKGSTLKKPSRCLSGHSCDTAWTGYRPRAAPAAAEGSELHLHTWTGPAAPGSRHFPAGCAARKWRAGEVTAAAGARRSGPWTGHEQTMNRPWTAACRRSASGRSSAASSWRSRYGRQQPGHRALRGGSVRAGPGAAWLCVCPVQLGAENADSIGAVLNSKDEQREIAETRETCRSVSEALAVQNWGSLGVQAREIRWDCTRWKKTQQLVKSEPWLRRVGSNYSLLRAAWNTGWLCFWCLWKPSSEFRRGCLLGSHSLYAFAKCSSGQFGSKILTELWICLGQCSCCSSVLTCVWAGSIL